ncbi:MAG TPA: hypothetical protein VHS09_02175, partial [Polyangiaceae bacterium]|nr:hypothetical protein [Polyangiaceae bacterium]
MSDGKKRQPPPDDDQNERPTVNPPFDVEAYAREASAIGAGARLPAAPKIPTAPDRGAGVEGQEPR